MANNPVIQSGVVTPGHVASFVTDGVVQDGGAPPNGALSTVAITNNGGLALGVTSANPPSEYTMFGIAVSSDGTITLSGNTYGGGAPAVINFDINGTVFEAGGLAPIGAGELVGNPGTVAAPPIGIAVGANLTLTAAGTLNATTVSGTTTTIVAGTGLAGGTIDTTGTISLGTVAASELLGNYGTAAGVPVGVVLGSGLTLLPAGTLQLGGTATLAAETVTGLLNAGTVASTGSVTGATGSITGLLNAGTVVLTTALAVGSGGVGTNTLPSAAALIGNGTSPITGVAPGTLGNVLTSTGSSWASSAPASGGVSSLTAGLGIVLSGTTGAVTASLASSAFAIGTYLIALYHAAATPTTGSTYAGSTLYNAATGSSYSTTGTWRCMGPDTPYTDNCCDIVYSHALFLRIA